MPYDQYAHPYVPNSEPTVQAQLLAEIGVKDIDELYDSIPEHLRFRGSMNLPGPLDEWTLRKELSSILDRNLDTNRALSFLGGGCWPHFIPAICDEIAGRAEFVTAYAGEPYEDHGRFQTLFEYQSLVAELVDMDVVNVPTFDWAQAASTSLRMAQRITGRARVLIPRNLSPDRRKVIKNYCDPSVTCVEVPYQADTGAFDLEALKRALDDSVAAIYFENPTYLGGLEEAGEQIAAMAHAVGALCVVGVDPISLGVLEPPVHYGADIVCGELQPLGIHMNYGGGLSGFIATADDPKFVMEYPSRLFGITSTSEPGEYGFGDVAYERTSFALREEGKESVGTQTAMWGIIAGVYLSLVGPAGLAELGQTILQRGLYARRELAKIPGVNPNRLAGSRFKEFVVDFSGTGQTVAEIQRKMQAHGIFAGIDLSQDFPELGQCALFCVTEVHTKQDIDRLASTLAQVLDVTHANSEEVKSR